MRNKKIVNMIKNQKGITLVELMIVLALLGIVLAVGYNLLFYFQRGFDRINRDSQVTQEVNIFMMYIEREVRAARATAGGPPAMAVNGNTLTINSDITRDGNLDVIEYSINTNTLMRSINGSGPEELISHVGAMPDGSGGNHDLFTVTDVDATNDDDLRQMLVVRFFAGVDADMIAQNPIEVNLTLVSRSKK